ncbi:uncharacterized protein [Macrobrachium rosenbergii]|uniref:uncharacterized protein n=1 Tax=Macrobrachium rosenbergii TaxID=79674 RepID=UPI0034D60508
MGVVLEQDTGDGRQSLAFFGKKLTSVEQKYSTFDRKLQAVKKPSVTSTTCLKDGSSLYLFIIIDRNTRWPDAVLIKSNRAETCVKALIGWVSRHRVPQIIMSYRAANFTSALWNTLANSLGTKIIHTMDYNPEVDGIIERLHRLLKASLTAGCQGRSWRKELPWVLLDLRTSPHVAFNTSPAEALYSQSLTLLADVFQHPTSPTSPSDTRKALEQIMPDKMTYHMARKVYVPSEL